MQKPTIGRIVLFYNQGETTPQAALIVAVHSETCINVSACNAGGTWHAETSVLLGDPTDNSRARWCWPPRS